ncbi:extensin family protein [Rhodobacteraceae bacterium MCCB 386]|nr:extensin family protein [Roseitranquillus sediminis]
MPFPQPEVTQTTRPQVSLDHSIRPEPRPENLRRGATVRASSLRLASPGVLATGSVCGDPAIRGETLAPIAGRLQACAIDAPVRVSHVAGLRLRQPAVMDCRTAKALKGWVEGGVKPAIGQFGGGPAGLRVAAHYVCRGINNQPDARVSEHGKGRAIDISGIVLASGQTLSVLHGWDDEEHGSRLRRMHRAACGRFGTVLGPEADRFHRDHFHFDTKRRGSSYCR